MTDIRVSRQTTLIAFDYSVSIFNVTCILAMQYLVNMAQSLSVYVLEVYVCWKCMCVGSVCVLEVYVCWKCMCVFKAHAIDNPASFFVCCHRL